MSYYDPEIHHRRSIRLDGYDYSKEGLYFLTCCCQDREYFFGEITGEEMILNEAGKMIAEEWMNLSDRFIRIRLHEFTIMPNHFHGIVEIVGAPLVVARSSPDVPRADQNHLEERLGAGPGQPQGIAPTGAPMEAPTGARTVAPAEAGTATPAEVPTIGDIVSAFKSLTTVKYIQGVKNANWKKFNKKLWQRNYYEHIIRNENSLNTIANYIIENPKRWKEDRFR